jgi:hypothetical protein
VRLTARARKLLARKRALTVKVRVTFDPASGAAASRVVSVRFKAPRTAARASVERRGS